MAYTYKHGDRPLDGVTIQRAVGRGGFGEVYYALTDSGKQVAVKYLRDNPEVELRGISHVMNLKSPYLITIYDVRNNEHAEPFVIMEYISGPSLRDMLNAEPDGFSPQKTAFLFTGMAQGLAYLHERGIVHRDMKPANIFYDDGYVKIGDYGLSKHMAVSRHSAQTVSVGTVHYMAPEIGSGNYSKAIDIYALGVILFEMLTGRLPFTGSSMAEILMRHVNDRPDLAGVPEPFRSVIARALVKDPAGRWQDVSEMLDALMSAGVSQSVASFDHSMLSHIERDPEAQDPDRTMTRSPGPRRPPTVPYPYPRPAAHAAPPVPLDVRAGDGVFPEIPPLPGERRTPRAAPRRRERPGRHAPDLAAAPAADPAGHPRRLPQFLTIVLAILAVAIGLGVLSGRALPETAVALAFMLYGATFGPVLTHFWLLRKNPVRNPFLDRVVYTGAAALCMGPGLGMAAEAGSDMPRIIIPLLVVLMVFDWNARIETGRQVASSGSSAIWPGVLGLIVAGGVNAPEPLTSGALCASVALFIPMIAALWHTPGVAAPRRARPAAPPVAAAAASSLPAAESAISASRTPLTPPPLPAAAPAADMAREAAAFAQPSFAGRTANAGASLLGKVLLLGGLALSLTYYGRPLTIQARDSGFEFSDGSIVVVQRGIERERLHVPQPLVLVPITVGAVLLIYARRRDGSAHMARALLACVFGGIASVLALGPGAELYRTVAANGIRGVEPGLIPLIVVAVGCVMLSMVLLFWPRARTRRTIVI
ncbi:MAG TPA: serine/threonine-protein kinase [Phycisphaerae bacterium]|nr:serine/threonine-protein kinase [Phycisphaerae bacterium]